MLKFGKEMIRYKYGSEKLSIKVRKKLYKRAVDRNQIRRRIKGAMRELQIVGISEICVLEGFKNDYSEILKSLSKIKEKERKLT